MNAKLKIVSFMLLAPFFVGCRSTETTTTQSKKTETVDANGNPMTVTEEQSKTTKTTEPAAVGVAVEAAGQKASIEVTTEGSSGTNTETPESGEEVPVPEETETVSTAVKKESKCPNCGYVFNYKRQGLGSGNSKHTHQILAPAIAELRSFAWPEEYMGISSAFTVTGPKPKYSWQAGSWIHPLTDAQVFSQADDIQEWFKNYNTSQPLLQLNGVNVFVDEILEIIPDPLGGVFHYVYWDIDPIERINLTLSEDFLEMNFDLNTPGATNPGTPINGWYRASIPVPITAFPGNSGAQTSYNADIYKVGTKKVGGLSRSGTLE